MADHPLRVFVLEDDPNRVEGFRAALYGHSVDYAICVEHAIRDFSPPYDLLLLDHDLGGEVMVDSDEANTGFQFVRWLVAHQKRQAKAAVFVHSWNPDGAKRMVDGLRANGWNVVRMQFDAALLRTLMKLKRAPSEIGGDDAGL
jgi:hypothetical protein